MPATTGAAGTAKAAATAGAIKAAAEPRPPATLPQVESGSTSGLKFLAISCIVSRIADSFSSPAAVAAPKAADSKVSIAPAPKPFTISVKKKSSLSSCFVTVSSCSNSSCNLFCASSFFFSASSNKSVVSVVSARSSL